MYSYPLVLVCSFQAWRAPLWLHCPPQILPIFQDWNQSPFPFPHLPVICPFSQLLPCNWFSINSFHRPCLYCLFGWVLFFPLGLLLIGWHSETLEWGGCWLVESTGVKEMWLASPLKHQGKAPVDWQTSLEWINSSWLTGLVKFLYWCKLAWIN